MTESYFSSGSSYILDTRIDEETPMVLEDITSFDQRDFTGVKNISFLDENERIVFGLLDEKTNKAVAWSKIDFQSLYENLSLA